MQQQQRTIMLLARAPKAWNPPVMSAQCAEITGFPQGCSVTSPGRQKASYYLCWPAKNRARHRMSVSAGAFVRVGWRYLAESYGERARATCAPSKRSEGRSPSESPTVRVGGGGHVSVGEDCVRQRRPASAAESAVPNSEHVNET